jgi:hypothetical protein
VLHPLRRQSQLMADEALHHRQDLAICARSWIAQDAAQSVSFRLIGAHDARRGPAARAQTPNVQRLGTQRRR